MKDGDKYEAEQFIMLFNNVLDGGQAVLASCNVRSEDGSFGNNLSKGTGSRFEIYVNGDYCAILNYFDCPYSSMNTFEQGWYLYPPETGACEEIKLNSSIAIFPGNTKPVSFGWWTYFMSDEKRFGTDIDPNTPLNEESIREPETVNCTDDE